jgi:hypothetical protein
MNTLFYWLPRTLCILAILFLSLFALDAFGPGMSLGKQIGGFLIHLIPSFILCGFLVVAWKWELIGGGLFVLIGLGFSPFIYQHNYQMNHSVGMSLGIVLMINAPFVLVGGLFILNHFLKNRNAL